METTTDAGTCTVPAAGRRARLLRTIRAVGGQWTTADAHLLYGRSAPQMGTARRDLAALYRAGHLARHDDHYRRYYTPKAAA